MSGKKILPFLLLIPILVIGCASTPKPVEKPFASKKWKLLYQEKSFSITKVEFENDLLSKVRPTDAGEEAKLEELKKTYGFNFDAATTKIYGQSSPCETLKGKLKNMIWEKIEKISPFTYIPHDNTACGWRSERSPCIANYKSSITQSNDNSITSHYDITVSWLNTFEEGSAYLVYAI